MSKHFAHERQPRNQIVRPCACFTESRESDRTDNAPTNAKRNAQMRMEPRPFEIFRLADRFWRQVIDRVLHREDLASAKFSNKPGEVARVASEGNNFSCGASAFGPAMGFGRLMEWYDACHWRLPSPNAAYGQAPVAVAIQ